MVTPLNQETGSMKGLYYETDDVWRGTYADFHTLGEQVAKAYDASEQKFGRDSYRDYKKSDWPSFRASGSTSIRQFESEYVRYFVEGAGSGQFVNIESPDIVRDIQLRTAANLPMALDLGDNICRMHNYFLHWQGHSTGQNHSELAQ